MLVLYLDEFVSFIICLMQLRIALTKRQHTIHILNESNLKMNLYYSQSKSETIKADAFLNRRIKDCRVGESQCVPRI